MTVAAGKESTLSINGSTVWRAKGGISTTGSGPAPSGTLRVVTKNCAGSSVSHDVHWHMGNTNASASFPGPLDTYSNPNYNRYQCYTGSHIHDHIGGEECHEQKKKKIPCPNKSGKSPCPHCGASNKYNEATGETYMVHHDVTITYCGDAKCSGAPNHWVLHGIMHGQIMNNTNAPAVGSCYYASGWTPDSAIVDSRTPSFRISLTESQQLQMYNTTVRVPSYRGGTCHLILKDDTVTYFKR